MSPATEQFTQQAIATYDSIVARGGWPTVARVDELRVGNRHPSVVDLRQRLSVSGDLDPNAVAADNDIYDSYVEEAVRRFQARHGVTVDGVIRASTLAALNVPAAKPGRATISPNSNPPWFGAKNGRVMVGGVGELTDVDVVVRPRKK